MASGAFIADHRAYLSLMMELADPESGFDMIHNHSLHHLAVVPNGCRTNTRGAPSVLVGAFSVFSGSFG
jgi:hypothetical protein